MGSDGQKAHSIFHQNLKLEKFCLIVHPFYLDRFALSEYIISNMLHNTMVYNIYNIIYILSYKWAIFTLVRFSKSILIASPDSSTRFHASVSHFWRRFQSSQNSWAQTAMKRANQTVHLLSKRLVNLTSVHDSRISTNWQLFAGPSHLGHKSRLSLHIARPTVKDSKSRFSRISNCLRVLGKGSWKD